jgi:hypothetical protein
LRLYPEMLTFASSLHILKKWWWYCVPPQSTVLTSQIMISFKNEEVELWHVPTFSKNIFLHIICPGVLRVTGLYI